MTKNDNIQLMLAAAGFIVSIIWFVLVLASSGFSWVNLCLVFASWNLFSVQHRVCKLMSTPLEA